MGLIQNKVTVSQPNSHVVVKNAGGLRGLTGETGPQGPQGVPGEAATVTAGTTTTLPAGSDATVQNVGSTSAAIFNFGVPKGDKGDTGESGAAATISVGTTTTLEPGEDATVTNTGTSSAAVFDFGIPKGAKGDTGSQGPAGADGFSPTATVSKTGDTATITITDKDGTTTAQISDGVTPTIDPALSPTSENPVQNKVVTNALAGKADKPIVVSSLPTTGTAGQEYFVDDRYNTVTELKGDTTQTTYSGKNLWGIPSTSSTVNYVTYTPASDGSFSLSGTANADAEFSVIVSASKLGIVAGQNYTFSATSSDVIYFVFNCDSSGTWKKTLMSFSPSGSPITATCPTLVDSYVRLAIRVLNGTSISQTGIKTQLESGNQATSFEPYVGGTASPNPGYPQEVQTVTGEQTVAVVGKNLLDESTMEQGSFNYLNNQESAHTGIIRMSSFISCQPNTTYTVSSNTIIGEFAVVYKDINGNIVEGQGFSVETQTYTTFTTKSNATEMRIRIGKGAYPHTAGVDYKLQLELGNQPTSYAPYQSGSYPVNLGKNLFDKDNANTLTGCYVDNDLRIVNTGNSTVSICYIKCEPNTTYTVQKENTGTNNRFALFTTATAPAAGVIALNLVGTNGAEDNHANYSITTPANAKYLGVFFAQPTGLSTPTSPEIMATIQIEKGSTATTYAPYFTPIELCKIGTYQDYIYKSGEDWYVKKYVGKFVFNGTETWERNVYAGKYYFTRYVYIVGQQYGWSNYFGILTVGGPLTSNVNVIRTGQGRIDLIMDGSELSLDDFKSWLSSHNTSYYYYLDTPTDTQITNSALIAQLEALAGAKIMVDGGTATVTSQYLPATLTTVYNSNSGYIDYIYDGTNFVKVR